MDIITSLPKSNNLPSYVQYDEDTLIKYVDRDDERYAVVRTSDELVHFIYQYKGETKYHREVMDSDGVWPAALRILDRLWLSFDEVEDRAHYFYLCAEEA